MVYRKIKFKPNLFSGFTFHLIHHDQSLIAPNLFLSAFPSFRFVIIQT